MTTAGWNLAEIWEHNADRFPDAIAQLQGDRTFTWAEFDRRADGIATALLAAGAQQQDKVAHYLYNCPEYLESMFGMFKAGLVPVNTNYRYSHDELVYLWTNADAVAGPDGQGYKGRQVVFETVSMGSDASSGVRVNAVKESNEPLRKVHNPNHPSADADGYVTHSNLNPVEEMVNMISASRSYQNNVEVMNTAKTLLLKTLQMGQ